MKKIALSLIACAGVAHADGGAPRKLTFEDAAEADRTFDMLMGPSVPPRKKFIQTHARSATLDI